MFEVAKAYEQRMGTWSKLLAPLFVEFVGVQGEVLDVGCGTGSLTFAAAEFKGVANPTFPTGRVIELKSQQNQPA